MMVVRRQQSANQQVFQGRSLVLRRYIDAFDGTKKDFSEVEHLFHALHHKRFTRTTKDGRALTREDLKKTHSELLSKGARVTLVHFRAFGEDYMDLQVRIESEDEDKLVRWVFLIQNGRFRATNSIASRMKACGLMPDNLTPFRLRTLMFNVIEKSPHEMNT
ncbi:hypothetical protein ACHAWF_012664 [Thalassiosira exigua]